MFRIDKYCIHAQLCMYWDFICKVVIVLKENDIVEDLYIGNDGHFIFNIGQELLQNLFAIQR